MKKFLKSAIAAAALAAGFSAVSIPLVHAQKAEPVVYNDAAMTEIAEHVDGNYNVNADGLTYGIPVDSVYVEDLPDLMAAIGDNGKSGYIYSDEVLDSLSSPEEAMEYQKSLEDGSYVPRVLNVYQSDGKTIIDTLTETLPAQYAK